LANRFIGIGEESTYRTPVAATEYIDVVREALGPSDRSFIAVETAGRRELPDKVPGPYRAGGSFDFIVNADNITKLLKWALGNVTTTDDGLATPVAYRHDFTPADEIKSFTIEAAPGVKDGATLKSRQFAGCAVRSLSLEAVARELLVSTVEVIAAKDALINSTTPTFSTVRPFVFFEGQLTLEGSAVANVEAFRVRIENSIPDDAHVLGDMFLPGIRLEGIRVTGDMDVAFLNWDLWKRFWGSATATEPQTNVENVGLKLTMTGLSTGSTGAGFENYKLEVDIPAAYLDTSEAGFDRRTRTVQSLGFEGVYDASAGHLIKVSVINKKSAP